MPFVTFSFGTLLFATNSVSATGFARLSISLLMGSAISNTIETVKSVSDGITSSKTCALAAIAFRHGRVVVELYGAGYPSTRNDSVGMIYLRVKTLLHH